jgi:predicted HicB family RNase H-like nuclease
MVRREILRRVGVTLSPPSETNASLLHYTKVNMKQKTDERVKKYCPILIPERLHRKLKEKARDSKLRLNQYIPRLLLKTLRTQDDSN